jgi:hypothetical protein
METRPTPTTTPTTPLLEQIQHELNEIPTLRARAAHADALAPEYEPLLTLLENPRVARFPRTQR